MEKDLPDKVRLVKGDDGVVRVDSRDVAYNFEKRHANVLRDIENLKAKEKQGELNFELCHYRIDGGREYPHYLINRKGFQLLVMGFTGVVAYAWKVKYIDAFDAMEEELTRRTPASINVRDYGQLAEIALQLIEVNKELKDEVAKLKPDAERMNMLEASKGSITMTAMAKMLDVKRPWLFDLMAECGWFYKQAGAHLPYAPVMKQGYLEVVPGHGKAIMRSSGAVEIKATTMVTTKGIAKITEIVKHELEKQAKAEHEEELAMMERLNHDDRIYGPGD
jgi:Rha family phage regulatory protein